MLAPNPQATVTWPIPGDAADLLAIVQDQAETITSQEALLHAYQQALNTAQDPPPGAPATSNAAVTAGPTNTIAVNGTAGTIQNGSTVTTTTGPVIAPGTTVLGQISGSPGKDGTYLLSAQVNLTAVTALSFTPPQIEFGSWPVPQDAQTLDSIVQTQTAVIRVQTALIQHYQDLLNVSQTPAPPTGP